MPSFPTAVATDAELLVAIDNAQTALAAGIGSGDTSLSVVSGAAIASNVVITVDSEMIKLGTVVGVNATGCTRGYGGTVAAAHLIGAVVNLNVIAPHHNLLAAEIKSMQAELGAGMAFVRKTVRTTAYSWSITPSGVALAGGGGAVAIALSPFPAGITASSVNNHYVKLQNEKLLITGVVAGVSITVAPVSAYSAGAWTISSATAGIQEAIYGTSSSHIHVPGGSHQLYQQVFVPRPITVSGDGHEATFLYFNSTTQNGFVSDSKGMTFQFLKMEAVGVQTAGAAIRLTGSTAGADIKCVNCEFENLYDVVYGDWIGGFIWLFGNIFRGILRHASYGKGSAAWAAHYSHNYVDGRTSIGLFKCEGILAGGIIASNWMQASVVHLLIASGAPVNEMMITGNLFDQDSAATACVAVEGTGVEGTSSNCIKLSGNFFQTAAYGVLAQNAFNVEITDNKFTQLGAFPAVTIAGVTCGNINIQNNRIKALAAGYSIQLSATTITEAVVKGNVGTATAACPALIALSTAASSIRITDNDAGLNYTKLIADVASTGAGEVVCKNNVARNIPSITVASAGTITLPVADEGQPVAITGTTTITEMNGVSARAGATRKLIMGGAVSWTVSAGDNKIGRAFGPTVAGQIVIFHKYLDNLWYPE